MSNPSTIFLTNEQLIGNGGDSISLANYGLISTANVGTQEGGATPMLELQNYNQSSPNLLLNGNFSDGLFTSWTIDSGSPTIVAGSYPGQAFQASINNLAQIHQQITGFTNKHPVCYFYHLGPEIVVSLELRDSGTNALIASQNRIFPKTDVWLRSSLGYYNDSSATASANIVFYSDNDSAFISTVNLMAVDSYAAIGIGDDYNQNKSVISMSTNKLFVGNNLQLLASRPELVDFRGNAYISGNLIVEGSIVAGPIYGSIGTQSWVSNIVFISGSATQINFTSGVIQLISGTSFGISSGNTGVMSQTSYLYLDTDVSSTALQITTTYSTVLGANKVFIGTAIPSGVTGNASFISQSNQPPLINAGDLITPLSITNGNLSANSITSDKIVANTIVAGNIAANTIIGGNIAASTITAGLISVSTLSSLSANFGNVTAGIVTLSGAGSYINFGVTPPTSSSGSGGTAGIFQDYTGIFSLSGTTLNASLTSAGLSAAGGIAVANSTGFAVEESSTFSGTRAYKFTHSSDGEVGGLYGALLSGPKYRLLLNSLAITGNDSEIQLLANAPTSHVAQITIDAQKTGGTLAEFTAYSGSSAGFTFDGGPIRFPVFTTAQMNALSAIEGMVVYNTTTGTLKTYNGASWV